MAVHLIMFISHCVAGIRPRCHVRHPFWRRYRKAMKPLFYEGASIFCIGGCFGSCYFFTMGRNNKRSKHLEAAAAARKKLRNDIITAAAKMMEKEKQRKKKERIRRRSWRQTLADFTTLCEGVKNSKGKCRTFEENRLLLFALKAALRRQLDSVVSAMSINWTAIETEIAVDFHVQKDFLRDLRKEFFNSNGEFILVNELSRLDDAEKNKRSKTEQMKMDLPALEKISQYIKKEHDDGGKVVTSRMIRNYTKKELGIDVSRRTIGRKLRQLGLFWGKLKPKKRTAGAYRLKSIRDYLIALDRYEKIMRRNDHNLVYVFMDESFVHKNHRSQYGYLSKSNPHIEGVSGSKGRRLCILHAMTCDGPLCEYVVNENGKRYPVDDLEWGKTDTPHSKPRQDGKLSCETLWVSDSSTGDYHDNMNSNLFMKWVKERLVKVFERKYPGKKMVLVMDNAAYHHKRPIGSLASIKKKDLVNLMSEHQVEYINLP